MFLATLALCALAPAPQDPLLKPPDQQKVAVKLAEYFAAQDAGDAKKSAKAYEASKKEVERIGKSLNKGAGLLSSPADLDAILQASGMWVKGDAGPGKVSTGRSVGDDAVSWAHWAPKTYEPKDATYPVVIWVLPNGTNPRNWLTEAAAKDPLAETHVIAATVLPKPASTGDPLTGAVMRTLRGVFTTFRTDHNRVFLAVEKADCVFALALANRFPHRFAGLILLSPEGTPPECKNLGGVAVYLGGNAEAWSKDLEAAKALVKAGESAPASVAEWVPNQQRHAYPDSIQFFPSHRAGIQSYWVRIEPEWTIGADKEVSFDPAKRPSFEVKVDREKNRITAQVVRVKKIEFLLNDAIVDLSKPVKIEVNGKVNEVQKVRELDFFLAQFLRTGDRGCSFTTSYSVNENDIPKIEAEKAPTPPEKGGAAGGAAGESGKKDDASPKGGK